MKKETRIAYGRSGDVLYNLICSNGGKVFALGAPMAIMTFPLSGTDLTNVSRI